MDKELVKKIFDGFNKVEDELNKLNYVDGEKFDFTLITIAATCLFFD